MNTKEFSNHLQQLSVQFKHIMINRLTVERVEFLQNTNKTTDVVLKVLLSDSQELIIKEK